jgi:hypothetical protein
MRIKVPALRIVNATGSKAALLLRFESLDLR